MTIQQLWQAILGELELTLSKANFTTWFRDTFISSWKDGKVIIAVPNDFTKNWFEKKYHKLLLKALQEITDNKVKEVIYQIEVKPSSKTQLSFVSLPNQERREQFFSEPSKDNEFGLNPRYTFSSFVVGRGNELAHAASQAIVQNPGIKYNPLFIYGGVGLGKTHLIQAIGHDILARYKKEKKLLYINAERFTNDYVHAVREGWGKEFQNTYRKVDILLVDDIQFIGGKERTQEEFFHTFNTLHQNNRQLVLTSDRPPKAIPSLEERLTSRFEWGMIADITAPDLETRMAILEAKCQERKLSLNTEIIQYLASNIQSNIRELEGALNKIIAYYELNRIEPTLDLIKTILQSITTGPRWKALTTKQLLETVASFYDQAIEDLIGNSRRRELVTPRQIAMYLMREEIKSSYPAIGLELGGRDHTTAMHAYSKIAREIENDEKIRQEINLIKQRLYNA